MVGNTTLKEVIGLKVLLNLKMYRSILEVFEYGEYDILDVEGKDVVDIGAFVGDSAIYFALRGARKVIAVKPHPEAYREMVENIKLNNLENLVIPINAGLSSREGSICIEDVDTYETLTSHYMSGECISQIPAITLNKLVREYGLTQTPILKIDCEGCEYEVILNDYSTVRMFEEIVLEYHGNPSQILKTLKKDYICKFLRKGRDIGLIYCKKFNKVRLANTI
jgi:FkbM family methyltransferase